MNRISLSICTLVLLAAGCAAPNMTSDHIMFPVKTESEPKPDRRLRLDFSSQYVLELPFYKNQLFNQKVEYRTPDDIEDFYPLHILSVGLFTLNFADSAANWALSLQTPILGLPALDATLKINSSYYLTVGTFLSGGQVLLQKRISWNGYKGSSLGLYGNIRYHWFGYTQKWCDDETCDSYEVYSYQPRMGQSTFVGLRYKFLEAGSRTRWGKGDRSWMITAGYNPTFKSPGVRIGYTY